MKKYYKWIGAAVGIVLLIGIVGVLFGNNGETRYQEQYELGIKYLSEGNYKEAIIAFEAAIEIDPRRTDAYFGAADAYAANGDYEMAVKVLTKGFDATGDDSMQEWLAQYKTLAEVNGSVTEAQLAMLKEVYSAFGSNDLQTAVNVVGIYNPPSSSMEAFDINNMAFEQLYSNVLKGSVPVVFDGECFRDHYTGIGFAFVRAFTFYYGNFEDGVPSGKGTMCRLITWYPEDSSIACYCVEGQWQNGKVIGEGHIQQVYTSANPRLHYQENIDCVFDENEVMQEGEVTISWADNNGTVHSSNYHIANGSIVINEWLDGSARNDYHSLPCQIHGEQCGTRMSGRFNIANVSFQNILPWENKELPEGIDDPRHFYNIGIGWSGRN